ncbi:MAG TPA: acyl-CoA dehydrogenase family protein [Candidatus Limnocylindrales bacterium]|nr:acyl-CoA dehydrogenase family protein [Candidatus Limnocylindrales bacterium]
MDLFESTPEAKFRKRVQSFAKEQVAPVAEKVEEGWFPREVLRKLGEQQLLGVAFSKSDGGLGLGWSFEVIVAEEISAVSGATEMARLASGALYAAPLAHFASRPQKRRFLRPVLAGEKVGALALTEPGAGSDAASIKTHAERRGQDFVLNGEKRFITNGGVADFLFVFAVTEPRKPPKSGVSALVVPREFEGVQVVKTYGLLGMRGANVVHLRFRNVRVPEENIVGGLHRGFPILLDELDRERPAVAAGMLGIARSAFESTVDYSSKRQQFGRPIKEFEGVSFKLSDMLVKLEASRLLIVKAARLLDEGKLARLEGATAKLFATESAFEITHQALQVHGGIGYTKDLPIERYFRDARFMMIGGGTSEIMRFLIQREIYRERSRRSS